MAFSCFFHENVQKSSIPKCHELRIPYHFYIFWYFHENVKKKLDTPMSQIKHPISFLSGFFHENVKKKSSIPKCHKLSITCQFYMVFPWKCHKKLDTQMSSTKHPSSPPNAAEAHVEPCTELSTDSTEKCPFSKVKQYEIARDFFPPNPSAAKKRLDFWSIRWLCKVTSICPRHSRYPNVTN